MPRLLLLALLLLLLSVSFAQTVEFALAYPAFAPTPGGGDRRAEVVFSDVPTPEGSAGLRLAAGDELGIGLRLRQASSLATIGNTVLTLAADASTAGRYGAAFTARGVLGPAALRVRASVHDGLPPLAPLAEGDFDELPLLGQGPAILGLEAGVGYRVSRNLIIGAAPSVYLRAGRWGGGLTAEAELLRLQGRNDVSLLFRGFAEPGFGRTSLAVGAGYTINRRRAPSWEFAGWVGVGPGGVAPGATIEGGERLRSGDLDLLLAAEPYRLDAWPYRLEADYQFDLGDGEFLLGLRAGLQPQSGWRAGGRVAYRLPFEP